MIETVITARDEDIGGFAVRRSLPRAGRRMVGPFTFLDHMGPTDVALDVPPHPHIGIATLTYLFEGALIHRDSLGSTQTIIPGEANWMISGRGIAHSERMPPGPHLRMHGVQAWLALPVAAEEVEPSFTHCSAAALPLVGETMRLISGEAYGVRSPAPSYSPHFYVDARLVAGASLPLPPDHEERAAYVVSGSVEVSGTRYVAGQLLVFAPGGSPALTATQASIVMLLGGANIGPRHMWWNFVSSRKERIEQAKADWAAGRIALPPDDRDEFVPLPGGREAKPEPMS